MTDQNTPDPQPRYGEYASPDEQRARIQQPAFETLPPPPGTVPPAAAVPPLAPSGQFGGPSPFAQAAASPRRRIDLFATIGLLVYGLFTVLTSTPRLLDPAEYSATLFAALGIESGLSDPAAALPWGICAVLVLVFGWLATAGLSMRRLRAGRIAFWVPIVGGVVFNLIAAVLMTVAIFNDPGVWSALQTAGLLG